jgi:type IV secretion system protein VirB10
MTEQTVRSPDSLQLRVAPVSSARLSKKAAFVAITVLTVILGVIITNVSKPQKKAVEETSVKKDFQPALNAAKTLTKDVPDIVPAAKVAPRPPVLTRTDPTPATRAAPTKSAAEEAQQADSAIPRFSVTETAGIKPAVAAMSESAPADNSPAGGQSRVDSVGAAVGDAPGHLAVADASGRPAPGAEQLGGEADLNRQEEKLGFLQKTRRSHYLDAQLTAPVSPYELKTGTVIPGTLISAMNSDLPGEIIAQVSQNVYDSATGNHLLVPQGAKLFGRYDSRVSFGQGRLLVKWERLIYPNSYTLELGNMSGHDQEGNMGASDRVNNHYGRIFGWAFLTSVLSAGYQLSQPQQTSALSTPSSQQVAAAAVGQQMAQLGAQIAARNMQVQPTIEVRKGYRFNVMVNEDVVFPDVYRP